jgi:hypothetical protein
LSRSYFFYLCKGFNPELLCYPQKSWISPNMYMTLEFDGRKFATTWYFLPFQILPAYGLNNKHMHH